MGLPNIDIIFKTQAASAVRRSQKGVVALIVKDAKAPGGHVLTSIADIPAELGADNAAYVGRAFLGYVNPPRTVLLYVLKADAAELTEALDWLATRSFDYLAGPPDVTAEQAGAIAAWIKSRRSNDHAVCKAVLPGQAADSEAVVNLTTQDIKVLGAAFTPAQYCSRVAGLIAGTPMTISCTYAPLSEVEDVHRLTRAETDAAIDAGEFVLFYDGEKVKVGRGVNSLTTVTQDKGEVYRKIKAVEAMDMIQSDIRMTLEDSYIGKYANSYDNRCLLITAIQGYFEGLEQGGILKAGASTVGVDMDAQRNYLKSTGVDVDGMTEQQIKEADTGSRVFLAARVWILDAIEDVLLNIGI